MSQVVGKSEGSSNAAAAAPHFEVESPPTDGISRVVFSKRSDKLLVSSWDKSVTLYDIDAKESDSKILLSYDHNAAVLSCALSKDDTTIISGGCDNHLIKYDIEAGKSTIIGTHQKPIRCVEICDELNPNILVSGSWDNAVTMWDTRASADPILYSHPLPSKIFAMTLRKTRLVVGTSDRQVLVYDMRNADKCEQSRESSLKHQTRGIAIHPNCEQFVMSSVEGRVAVEYFDTSEAIQRKKYAFKCHRITNKQSRLQTIYPVNSVAFNEKFSTFATGGCDGVVNIWDGNNKKRICQFPSYPTSVACLDFNHNSSLLAIAASYTWEQGPPASPHAKDSIFIRYLKDQEIKPKVKK